MITASRPDCDADVYSNLLIETGPGDDDPMVSIRLDYVPILVARLLELHESDRGVA